jgi:hypothetical protein
VTSPGARNAWSRFDGFDSDDVPAPAAAGRYFVLVRNRAGTTVSAETTVTIKPAGANE